MNLLCGVLGVILTLGGRPDLGFLMMILGAVFDFFDGFAARMLKASSGIGKELDSWLTWSVSESCPRFCYTFPGVRISCSSSISRLFWRHSPHSGWLSSTLMRDSIRVSSDCRHRPPRWSVEPWLAMCSLCRTVSSLPGAVARFSFRFWLWHLVYSLSARFLCSR